MTAVVAGQTIWGEITGNKPLMGKDEFVTWSHFPKHKTDTIVQNIVRVHIEEGAKRVAVSLINTDNKSAFFECRKIAQEKSLGTVFCTDHGNYLFLHAMQYNKLASKESVELVMNDGSGTSLGKVSCKEQPEAQYGIIFKAYGVWGKANMSKFK